MSKSAISYSKELRALAKRKKQYMITISVNGSEITKGRLAIQRLANEQLADKVSKFAYDILRVRL